MIVQLPKHKSLYQQTGGLFPARRYLYGMSEAMVTLKYLLFDYIPQFDLKAKWELGKGKVATRDPDFWRNHPYGPILIAGKEDWTLDMVIDFYTESARVATPGYGEEFSPFQLWQGVSNTNDRMGKLFTREVTTPAQAREAMYDGHGNQALAIQEARLAYVTCSKGLYLRLKTHAGLDLTGLTKSVLDISAFGDRMVAAVANGLHYTGVDPDPNLVEGMSKLRRDLEKFIPDPGMRPQLYTLPLEGFWSNDHYDIVTLSMPPFDMELYEGGERQTHRVYKDFHGWINGFVRETLQRAREMMSSNGILAFSVLDRPADSSDRSGSKNPKGSKNPESGVKPTIVYTEAMIKIAEGLGFEFIEIFGFPKRTPWWIFRANQYPRGFYDQTHLLQYYPELMPVNLYTNNTPLLEYIRRCVQKYIIGTLEAMPEFSKYSKKIERILGQFLMAKGELWEKNEDPLFFDQLPASYPRMEELESVEVDQSEVCFQTADPAFYIDVYNTKINGVLAGTDLVVGLYKAAKRYMNWIVTTTGYNVASERLKFVVDSDHVSLVVEKRFASSVIGFIRRYVPIGPGVMPEFKGKQSRIVEGGLEVRDYDGATLSLWRTMRPFDSIRFETPDHQGMSDLRYDTVNAYGNHFTRPQSRMKIMEQIAEEPLIDLFATPFNTNTEKFCSLYPDVDSVAGSLGSFFNVDLREVEGTSTFMANPPDFPDFVKNVMDIITKVLNESEVTFFLGTVLWEDVGIKYLNRIRKGEDPEFGPKSKSGNFILDYCWDKTLMNPDFLKVVYILDKNTYPSLNPMTGKTSIREGSESIGVILSSKVSWNTPDSLIDKLGPAVIFG